MKMILIKFVDMLVKNLMYSVDAEIEYKSFKRKLTEAYPVLDMNMDAVEDEALDHDEPFEPQEVLPVVENANTLPLPKKVEKAIKATDFTSYKITDFSERNFTFDSKHPAYRKLVNSVTHQEARIFPNYPESVDASECYFLTVLFPLQLAIGRALPESIYEPILAKCIESGAISVDEGYCYMTRPQDILIEALKLIGQRSSFRVFQVGTVDMATGKKDFYNGRCEELGFNFCGMCGATSWGTHWRTGSVKLRMFFDPWKKNRTVPITHEMKAILYYFKYIGC